MAVLKVWLRERQNKFEYLNLGFTYMTQDNLATTMCYLCGVLSDEPFKHKKLKHIVYKSLPKKVKNRAVNSKKQYVFFNNSFWKPLSQKACILNMACCFLKKNSVFTKNSAKKFLFFTVEKSKTKAFVRKL